MIGVSDAFSRSEWAGALVVKYRTNTTVTRGNSQNCVGCGASLSVCDALRRGASISLNTRPLSPARGAGSPGSVTLHLHDYKLRVNRLVQLVTHDATPLLELLQSFYSRLYRHRNDIKKVDPLRHAICCSALWFEFLPQFISPCIIFQAHLRSVDMM